MDSRPFASHWGGPGDAESRPATRVSAQSLVLLPLLLFPAQLLAADEPEVARAARIPLHAAAGLSGLPRVPRKQLALRILAAPTLLQRLPLLARPVLGRVEAQRHTSADFADSADLNAISNLRICEICG